MDMDMVELGKRIKLVRSQVLKMNQKELAEELNSYQALISRLEKGIGGSLELVLDFINLLNKQGFNGQMLFAKKFSIEWLTGNITLGKKGIQDNLLAEKLLSLKNTLQLGYEQVLDIDQTYCPNNNTIKKNIK